MPRRDDAIIPTAQLDHLIYEVRGQKVMLDSDLARVYGVPTKRLNEQVKRNRERFPDDFGFQVTPQEAAALRSQAAPPNKERPAATQGADTAPLGRNRSQSATGSQKHRDPRYLPHVFTEHGAIMAATVLNNPRRNHG